MGESTSEIEREIRTERAELDRNLDVLEQKTRDLADWRVHFRNKPGAFLAVAAGAGALVGVLSTSGSGSARIRMPRMRVTDPGTSQPLAASAAPSRVRAPFGDRGPKRRELVDTWEHVSEALLGVVLGKAIEVVSDFIPGFRDEYDLRAGRPSAARHSGPGAADPGMRSYREPERRDH